MVVTMRGFVILMLNKIFPGSWQVIVQTDKIVQRVGVDMCHDPELPCPGLADCGKKSRCVQRYNYQVRS